MHRTAAAIAVTVIGLWLILSFKSSPVSHVAAAVPAPASSATSAAPSDTAGQPPAGPPAPGTGPVPTTTTPSGSTRTIDGDVVSNHYGEVQVAVVLDGKKIVDVKALKLPVDRARSAEISDQAAPLLHDEVLQAQSAQIDTIGGASYTSDSYAKSLQSALDKAGRS